MERKHVAAGAIACAIGAFIIAGTPAKAALITCGGDLPIAPFGGIGPLGIGAASNQPFGAGGGNHFITGRVIAQNIGGLNFTLTLTDLEYRSDVGAAGGGPVVETIRIQQDFTAAFAGFAWAGNHQLDGSARFNRHPQNASINAISTHEGVALPPLAAGRASMGPPVGLPQVFPLAAGPLGAAGADAAPLGIYRMDVTYTLTMGGGAGGGSWVSITMPSSGHDEGYILIPGPGGTALLGLGGALAWKRRRGPA